jgi:hypothetical protein
VLSKAQGTISHGLLWVFVTMLGFALLQLWISRRLPRAKRDHKTTAAEAMEAAIG